MSKPYVMVVGMDFSELGREAFSEAVRLSAAHPNAEVHPIHVDSDFRSASEAAAKAGSDDALSGHTTTVLDRIENECNDLLKKARDAGVNVENIRRVVTHFRLGAAADQIVQLAVDLDADMIVVGTHGRTGLKRLVLGSVAQRVLKTARCPVMVMRPKDHEDAGEVPEIEPPCPDCVAAREASAGTTMWCKRHSEHHIRPHRYSYTHEADPRGPTIHS